MQNEQMELIIGKNLSDALTKNEALALISRIKNLREECEYIIPPVHITDEIKTDSNCYEIRRFNKLFLKQEVSNDRDSDELIDEIIINIDRVCKTI